MFDILTKVGGARSPSLPVGCRGDQGRRLPVYDRAKQTLYVHLCSACKLLAEHTLQNDRMCVAVVQRCFPDFITRNGILTVANQTIFKDGHNNERSVSDLKDAAK